MASLKDDEFTRCFADFVKFLNVVEPYEMQSGILDCRIGFMSSDAGDLTCWMQDLMARPDCCDLIRYSAVYDRVDRFVRDLNRCRSFADDKIAHTFDLFDQNGCLNFLGVDYG